MGPHVLQTWLVNRRDCNLLEDFSPDDCIRRKFCAAEMDREVLHTVMYIVVQRIPVRLTAVEYPTTYQPQFP